MAEPRLDPRARAAFQEGLEALRSADVPFVIAGAFALHHHTGIWRDTKDLDLFCEPAAAAAVLAALAGARFATYVEERHWLGKAVREGVLIDVIWAGGNWATVVDPAWLAHARPAVLLGGSVRMAAPEDIILSKAYVAGRERFDGTDIAHLVHACGRAFDWEALVGRFGDHWPLLLHYLVLYRFVYPEDRDVVPAWVIHGLAARIGTEAEVTDGLAFRGPLLDRYGYLHDLDVHGRPDPREVLAARAGLPVADVVLRRHLDGQALAGGRVYRDGEKAPDWVSSAARRLRAEASGIEPRSEAQPLGPCAQRRVGRDDLASGCRSEEPNNGEDHAEADDGADDRRGRGRVRAGRARATEAGGQTGREGAGQAREGARPGARGRRRRSRSA